MSIDVTMPTIGYGVSKDTFQKLPIRIIGDLFEANKDNILIDIYPVIELWKRYTTDGEQRIYDGPCWLVPLNFDLAKHVRVESSQLHHDGKALTVLCEFWKEFVELVNKMLVK